MSMSANRATGRCTGSVYLLHSPSIVSSKRLITAVQLAHRFCINRHDDDLPSAASRTVRPTKTSSAIGCACVLVWVVLKTVTRDHVNIAQLRHEANARPPSQRGCWATSSCQFQRLAVGQPHILSPVAAPTPFCPLPGQTSSRAVARCLARTVLAAPSPMSSHASSPSSQAGNITVKRMNESESLP